MLSFGPDAIIEFSEDCVSYGYVKSLGRYCVDQIDVSPPGDFSGHMKILSKVYAEHFARQSVPAVLLDGEGPLRELNVYTISIVVAEGATCTFPLMYVNDFVRVIEPGFLCPVELHQKIWVSPENLNLIEYPSRRVESPIQCTVAALSARKDISYRNTSFSMSRAWKAALLTDKNRYLSRLRYGGALNLEQFVPLIEKDLEGIFSHIDLDYAEENEDRFSCLG